MTKLTGATMDIAKENIEQLKRIFPDVFTEGKVDYDKLRQVLGEYVEESTENYSFTWNGKGQALKLAQTPTAGTLRPCKEDSKNWDSTKNLYIEGDNLEVLKLLQKSYFGKVKMIYIDPPYNTGKDFVYKDDFRDSIQNYKEITGQVDGEGKRVSTNAETSGRYHTDWLNMMYPRLRLARNLLTEDGVIFISIDDNEVTNLRKICDEIFGEDNFINIISVMMKNTAGASGGGEDKKIKKNIEYLLVYTKNYNKFQRFNGPYKYTEISELISQYQENGVSWKYNTVILDFGDKEYLGSTVDGDGNLIKIYKRKNYKINSVKQLAKEKNISEIEVYKQYALNVFRTTNAQSSIRTRIMDYRQENGINDELISIEYIPRSGRNKGKEYEQFYLHDNLFVWLKDTSEIVDNNLYKKDVYGTYWDYVGETKNLTKEGNIVFANGKKPVKLIKQLIEMIDDSNSIILDFFSGSATTAHAVMQLNAEDGGKRQYIMVQLPELTEESSEAYKAGYKNIYEIGKERIHRAGEKIKEEKGMLADDLDIGFKVFKLDTSNILQWQPKEEKQDIEELKRQLMAMGQVIATGRTDLDVVYEIMLKMGLDLTYPVEELTFAGKKVYSVGTGALLICLADTVPLEIAEEMLKYKDINPELTRIVFSDKSFKNDSTKISVKERFTQAGFNQNAFMTI